MHKQNVVHINNRILFGLKVILTHAITQMNLEYIKPETNVHNPYMRNLD